MLKHVIMIIIHSYNIITRDGYNSFCVVDRERYDNMSLIDYYSRNVRSILHDTHEANNLIISHNCMILFNNIGSYLLHSKN